MESDTDASIETQPSSISFLDLDIPRPLQIVKKIDDPNRLGHHSSRKKTSWSHSVVSNDSVSEVPAADWPLSIPKKRFTTRDIRNEAASQKSADDSGYSADVSTPGQVDSDVDETTPKPRRSTSDMSPARAPEYYPPNSLTTKASMLCLTGRKFPGRPQFQANLGPLSCRPQPDTAQRYNSGSTAADMCIGQTSTPPTSRISSSNFDLSDTTSTASSAFPFLLVPRVVVTPECQALDVGTSTL